MIIKFEDLAAIREKHSGDKIIYTGGCFDLLHEGHAAALEWRRGLGDLLIVGVLSDERVRSKKGPGRPIRSEQGRLLVVDAFKNVDYAFIIPMPNETQSPTEQVVEKLQPNVFVDSIENETQWVSARPIEELGVQVVFDEFLKLDSTTAIINRINALKDETLPPKPPQAPASE